MESTETPYRVIADASDRASWLAARGKLIGASDVPAIMGLSPWATPLSLYAAKLGYLPEPEASERLEWGLRLEEPIRQAYEERTGRPTRRAQQLLGSLTCDGLGATLDAWATVDGAEVPLEIKTTHEAGGAGWADGVPEHYRAQIHAQMYVVGAELASAAVLIGGQRMRWFDLEADAEFTAAMVERVREFQARLRDRRPPAPTGDDADMDALRALFPKEAAGAEADLAALADLDAEYSQVDAEIKRLEARKEIIRQTVAEAIGAAEVGRVSASVAWTWKTVERKAYTVEVKASSLRQLRRTAKKERGSK